MTRVYLLYGLSGFVSLGYQVAWFRIYVDRFGSTTLTFALVLCNFIGGLGAGALASRRVGDGLVRRLGVSDRLRIYGWVELLVSVSVVLTIVTGLIPGDAWGTFPYAQRAPVDGLSVGLYSPTLGYQISKLALATLSVFLPCFLMGVTFPLLCDVFRRDGRFPSALYAWNTLGACSAVLICQLVLLPRVGHGRTLWIVLGLNVLLGAYFVWRGGAPIRDGDFAAPAVSERLPGGQAVPVALAALSGLLAGALEGDMFKRVEFLGGSSGASLPFVSFWAILAIFLGSWIVRASSAIRLFHIKIAYVVALVLYWIAWKLTFPVANWTLERALTRAADTFLDQGITPQDAFIHFPTSLVALLLIVGMLVFPTFLLVSLLLPYACNRLQSRRTHLGVAYGLNTVAFCVGIVAFTWVAPGVNTFYSMKLILVLLAVGVGLLLTISERRPLPRWSPAVALLVFGVGAVVTPASFDPAYVDPASLARRYPVRALKSNGAHTTYVVADPQGDRLYFENYSMSANTPQAHRYMRLMAHVPLLAQPRPTRALLICFGVGNTASAIAAHDTIERIDVVELNDIVLETAPEFSRTNRRVYDDPRVELIVDDGRNFLDLSDRTYDLVTSEPPPPMMPGVYRLYSTEYYEQILARLTPQGMMTQWLPTYLMPPRAVELAIGTFVDVFPHTLLFVGDGRNFILVGGKAPIDLAQLESRFYEQPGVVEDLRRVDVARPVSLLARIVQGDRSLRRRYAGERTISDQRNDLAYMVIDPLQAPVVDYDPAQMLDDVDASRLRLYPELRAVVTHLGRLTHHVPDFPTSSLATIRSDPSVALSDVDWTLLFTELPTAYAAYGAGRPAEAITLLETLLRAAPEQPRLLLDLARMHLDARDFDAASIRLRQFRRIEPDDPAGPLLECVVLARSGRTDEAIDRAEEALRLDPGNPAVRELLDELRGGD